MKAKDGPVEKCMGFIDCTKIRMERTTGRMIIRGTSISENKRMTCLINQTLTTKK